MTAKQCNVAVLASGRGSNFRAIAEACAQEAFPARVSCFVTDNPEAPALEIAREFGIAAHVVPVTAKRGALPTDQEEAIAESCASSGANLIALAGFMRILKGPLLERFEGGIMNIHPSLLPSFKGLHAVRQALDYGVKVTGPTVHFVDRSIDGGAIILQAPVGVSEDDYEASLLMKINREEHRIYVRAIELFARGKLRIEGRRVRIIDSEFSTRG